MIISTKFYENIRMFTPLNKFSIFLEKRPLTLKWAVCIYTCINANPCDAELMFENKNLTYIYVFYHDYIILLLLEG